MIHGFIHSAIRFHSIQIFLRSHFSCQCADQGNDDASTKIKSTFNFVDHRVCKWIVLGDSFVLCSMRIRVHTNGLVVSATFSNQTPHHAAASWQTKSSLRSWKFSRHSVTIYLFRWLVWWLYLINVECKETGHRLDSVAKAKLAALSSAVDGHQCMGPSNSCWGASFVALSSMSQPRSSMVAISLAQATHPWRSLSEDYNFIWNAILSVFDAWNSVPQHF